MRSEESEKLWRAVGPSKCEAISLLCPPSQALGLHSALLSWTVQDCTSCTSEALSCALLQTQKRYMSRRIELPATDFFAYRTVVLAFKHHISFAMDLAANFGGN